MGTNKPKPGFFSRRFFRAAFPFLCLLLSSPAGHLAAAEAPFSPRRDIPAHEGAVNGVDISPDGRLLVSGGGDGRIAIWNLADGGKRHSFGEYREVADVSFAPDGKTVICAASENRRSEVVQIWDYAAAKMRLEIRGHSQKINAVAFSPDGRMIASGGDDNTLRTWYGNGREIHTFENPKNDFLALAWSPDSAYLAGGLSWDGNILIWDARRDQLVKTLTGHSDWVNAVLYAPDGRHLISGGRDGSIRVWESESGRTTTVIREDWWEGINDLALSGDGLYLAGATGEGSVVVWYADSGKTLAVLSGHAGPVRSVAFSADSGTIVSGGADGTIKLWTAPAAGTPEELFALAAGHDRGTSQLGEDRVEAFKWYLKAAAGGYLPAMIRVGEMYGSGAGVAADPQEAVKWLAAAADRGDAGAMYLLGNIYADGRGGSVDPDKAAELWAQAAERGHVEAKARLSRKVETLDIETVDKNSLAWLEKAADAGDVKAMYDLALVYGRGSGDVARDAALAARWFTAAAGLNHAEAQYHLGGLYAAGSGVEQSGNEAVRWWRKAAAQGHVEALYRLGLSYAEGKGVKRDDREAAELFKKAAGRGNVAAKYRLGLLYCTGKGVGRDYGAAVQLWKEAAGQGDAMAIFFLGYMHETGSGLVRNPDRARKYYQEAARRGNLYAEPAQKLN